MLTALLTLSLSAAPVRVAVLPFENATNDPELEVLRRGLADLLVTDLIGNEPLVVVERARLDEVFKELKLQQSKAFDATQTVRAGKLVGATHVIACTLVGTKPLHVTARVIDVSRNENVLKAVVTGKPEDIFELEEKLVQQLVTLLRAKYSGTTTGHGSLDTVVTWAQGADLADRGLLDEAKSKLAEAVRNGPDFTLAKEKYAEVLKALRDAQKKRGSALDERASTLSAHLVAQLGKPPVQRALGARIGLANLALLELSRKLNAKKDEARYVRPELRAEVEGLEARFVEHAGALISELEKVRGKNLDAELSDEDAALSEEAFGLDVSKWDFASPTSVAIDLGTFLGSGWTPYRSDVAQFAVRPSAAQRTPAQLEAAKRWFDTAAKSLPLDEKKGETGLSSALANERAELFVLLGRREEGVAQWQAFLDAHPTASEFPVFSKKLAAVMLLDDDADREERQLEACDAALLEQGALLATRTWRAKGRAGLVMLREALGKCEKKDSKFGRAGWALVAAELQRVADCEGYELHRARAAKAGVMLEVCR